MPQTTVVLMHVNLPFCALRDIVHHDAGYFSGFGYGEVSQLSHYAIAII
ncbi:MAG: hypothetical protein Q8Q81_17795 [Oxalobacteraceae bacterium]|nr:hypothetical protein [Oxalobacteraceae bacterium]